MNPRAMVDYYHAPRNDMLPFVPHGAKRILEVGCAAGEFGALLKRERNAEVWGIELNETMAREAAQKLDRVLVGDALEQIQALSEPRFDCVVCNDVLEHLSDPWTVLRTIPNLLYNGGRVVASLPNFRYVHNLIDIVIKGDFAYTDSGILDRTHLRFFTKKSILQLFEETGYELEVLQGINPTMSRKFAWLNRLLMNRLEDTRWLQYACVAQAKPLK